jgi:phosphate transport system permease protein
MASRVTGFGADAASRAVGEALLGRRRPYGELIFQALLLLSLIVALGILLWLLADIVAASMPVWQERGLGSFLGSNLSSNPAKAGVAQGLFGSAVLMIFVSLVAIPVGVAAAVDLEEYAPDNFVTRTLNTTVRNLAGVPAVVYGLLGIAVFVTALKDVTGGRTVIAGGLTLALVVLPIVIIATAEALRAVPASIREAGFGVGATRWEVIRSHVLPYAAPGVFTGIILTIARAFGETAPLLLVGAAAAGFATAANASILDRLTTPAWTSLPTVIFNWVRQPQKQFVALTAAAIVVLLVVVLLINAIAIILRNRYARRW